MKLSATQDVFELGLARPVVARSGEHPALVHLWWSAPDQGDRLVQVYVDDELVEVSQDPSQRDLWLMCDRSRDHRIELLAVPVSDADGVWRDRPDLLRRWDPAVKSGLSLAVLRDEALPIDTCVSVEVDGQPIDHGPMWPAWEHRGGMGALFGLGAFGFDAVTGPGLGVGELGMGPLGTDGTAWRWARRDLDIGQHVVGVSVRDGTGREVVDPVLVEGVVVESLPAAASSFSIDPDFTLRWSS